MGTKTFILLEHPIESTKVEEILGRFVVNPENPLTNFVPEELSVLRQVLRDISAETMESESSDTYKAVVNSAAGANAQLRLLSLFGIGGSGSNVSRATLSGSKPTTRTIMQCHQVFKNMTKNGQIKDHLLQLLREHWGLAYFATGVLILQDGNLVVNDHRDTSIGADGHKLPSGEVKMNGITSMTESTTHEWTSPKICAVQYYKVYKRYFASNSTIEPGPHTRPYAVYGGVGSGSSDPAANTLRDVILDEFNPVKEDGVTEVNIGRLS